MSRAKETWEDLAADDAYYAVATFEKFRKSKIDPDTKEEFFQTGHDHVERISSKIEKGFGIKFNPQRALDYGCGVGRILVALAEKCETVVGVDISGAMLDETRKNCADRDTKNVELQDAAEFSGAGSDTYDFVHSYIVLQHIDPKIGNDLIRTMLERLAPDGVGMLHVTFFDPAARFTKLRFRVYRDVPFVYRMLNAIRGRNDPLMPMYEYDLNRIFCILHRNGCAENFVEFSDHGFLGVLIFFRKSGSITY